MVPLLWDANLGDLDQQGHWEETVYFSYHNIRISNCLNITKIHIVNVPSSLWLQPAYHPVTPPPPAHNQPLFCSTFKTAHTAQSTR